jgi:3'(2'), 5'-bisphosphate nucleotidase
MFMEPFDDRDLLSNSPTVRLNLRIEDLIEIIRMAAFGVLKFYRQENSREISDHNDNVNLTLEKAKSVSLQIIRNALMSRYPNIPVICDESVSGPIQPVEKQRVCFCVCPLDGSIDFIRKNDTLFCISIGVCLDGKPEIGLICLPAYENFPKVYYGICGVGVFAENDVTLNPERIEKPLDSSKTPIMLTSKTKKYYNYEMRIAQSRSTTETIRPPTAISLRFLMIILGQAGIYPQLSPTSEWETCAGHAIARAMGFEAYEVVNYEISTKAISYGKSQPLNPPFVLQNDQLSVQPTFTSPKDNDEVEDTSEISDVSEFESSIESVPRTSLINYLCFIMSILALIAPVIASFCYYRMYMINP